MVRPRTKLSFRFELRSLAIKLLCLLVKAFVDFKGSSKGTSPFRRPLLAIHASWTRGAACRQLMG